eukprot:GEMP01081483.1.p1 GENE.GEMP01081483.1~~GEMP01081483.1.p1  ORF type:complete len:218 (+),score=47.52 GEMP01081483.1:185-838(+)
MKWIVLYPALAFRLRQHARSGMHSVPLFTTDICMGMPLQTSCALFKLQKVNTYCDSNKDDPDCEDIRQCVPAECNFGHCVNGHCRCNPGYSGVQCDVPPSVVPTETLAYPTIAVPVKPSIAIPYVPDSATVISPPSVIPPPIFASCQTSLGELTAIRDSIRTQHTTIQTLASGHVQRYLLYSLPLTKPKCPLHLPRLLRQLLRAERFPMIVCVSVWN